MNACITYSHKTELLDSINDTLEYFHVRLNDIEGVANEPHAPEWVQDLMEVLLNYAVED